MMLSLNCLILGQASKKGFTEDIGERYTNDDNLEVEFSKFKVSHLIEKLIRRQTIKDINQNSEHIDLWKVDSTKVDEEDVNLEKFTESDIKSKLGAGPSQGVPQGPNWNDASSIYEWIQQQFTLDRKRKRVCLTCFGKDFELLQRDDTITTLWNAGGPGIGKSRILDEVEGLIKKKAEESRNNDFTNMIVINTSYGNSTTADDIDEKVQAQVSLAIRILFEYFRPNHNYFPQDYNFVSFRSYSRQHHNNSNISDFTLDTAFQIIYYDFMQINQTTLNPQLVLVLGIDEFNKLHVQNKNVCKKLIHAIGGSMCGSPAIIFFIPILAGTIEGPLIDYISGSMHEPLPLPLRLLNDDDAIRIGMKMNLIDDEYVSLHPYFRISISDIGGHCRTLEYYYEIFSQKFITEHVKLETEEILMTEEEKLKTAARNVNIENIMEYDRIVNKYHLELNSCWLTITLAKAILEYLIRLPYVWDEPINWQNFEDFNAKLWALRLNLFRLIGYEKIKLKTLCKGAEFSLSFPDVEVDLPKAKNNKLYKLLHRYPVRNGYIDLDLLKNDNIKEYIGCVFLNAPGPPWDVSWFLNDESSKSEICVVQQEKLATTIKVVIDQDLFDKEHAKVIKAMRRKIGLYYS
ncbi:14506_t:CDS:2 [Funneliformis mosseae]|uniref:14506_t:CDS:1 n=1 Tax=Funneliformis mosseae TaxID=27381 RepID=A0A9N9A1I8_FUNMO|nr:14506_t:CDS:2 [Funneliformis mosseae]